MTMTFRLLILTAALALLPAVPAAADDLTVMSSVTARGKTSTSAGYFSATAMRTSDGRHDVIVDFASEKMITIDHKKKTWSEVSFAELRDQMKEVERMLADNPMLANMIGEATAATVEKLGSTRQVAGHACNDYRVTLGKKMQMSICAAPSIDPPIDIFQARKMAGLMMGPMAAHMNKLYDALAEVKGFPLVTETAFQMMGMNLDSQQVATEVTSGVPGDAFDVPAGYKQKKGAM